MPLSKANQQIRRETLRRIRLLDAATGVFPVEPAKRLRDGQTMFPRQWLPDALLPDGSAIIYVGSVLEMKWIGKNQKHCGRYYRKNLSHGATQMYIIMSPTYKVLVTFTIVRKHQCHNRFRLDECVRKFNARPSAEQERMIEAWLLVEPLLQEIRDRVRLNHLVTQLEAAFKWYEGLIDRDLPLRPPPAFLL